MENYEMKSNRDVDIIDEEISKIDTKDSIKARLYIELNTAHSIRAIKEQLEELNSILRHKSGIEQPDGWDSSKNQKDTEDSTEPKKLEEIAEWVCTESLSFERLRNDISDIKNANESGNMVVPENVINDIDGLRNDVDDLSQQVDTLRDNVDYKSNEDHDHDDYIRETDLEDLESRIDDKIVNKISTIKKDFSEPQSVTITWREDEWSDKH